MAVINSDVRVNITAESKQAKQAINDIARSLSALNKTAKDASPEANNLNLSVGNLAKGFAIGQIAVQGINTAVQFLKQEFINSVREANSYTNALIGLSSVSAAFGQSQSSARDAAVSLSRDGLMSVTESAEGLKNLLATGFNLPQAIELMKGFKDAAAFNRQGTLEFGQAIVGATQGLKNQNSIMVDNVGITKNLSNILKEQGLSVEQLGDVTSNASVRQKLYNGLMKEASVFHGDAGRAAETLGGKMSTLDTMFKMARVEVGQALTPALGMLIDDFMLVANVAGQILIPAIKAVTTIFIGAVSAARLLGNTISGIVAMFMAVPDAIQTGSLDPLKNTFKVVGDDYASIMENSAEQISKVWNSEVKDIGRSAVAGLGNSSAAVSKAAQQLAKQLKKENEDYISDISKMTKNFEESLNDLVFAHRDKRKQLEKDINDENKTYDKKMNERKDKYDEDVVDMEDSHKEKTESIKADIAEEEGVLIASQNKLEAFQDDKYLQDISRSKAKLLQLKNDLTQENAEYDKQKAKLSKIYNAETEEIKAEHNERLDALKAELTLELQIYAKYETDFMALKDKVAEDDISRLKRKFAEEKAEREKDHMARLAELYQQGSAESAAKDAGRSNRSASDTSRQIAEAQKSGATAGLQAVRELPLGGGVIGVGSNAPATNNTSSFLSGVGNLASSIGSAISNTFGNIVNWFSSNLPHFAEGGVVEGQVGKPVMAVVHAGERIIPVGEGEGGSVTNNITVNVGIYAGSEIEKRNLAMKLWNEVGRLAQSQNKTPSQLIGFNGA